MLKKPIFIGLLVLAKNLYFSLILVFHTFFAKKIGVEGFFHPSTPTFDIELSFKDV